MTTPVQADTRREPVQDMALRVVGALISTAWLGCAAVAVVVFGAGGWESWLH